MNQKEFDREFQEHMAEKGLKYTLSNIHTIYTEFFEFLSDKLINDDESLLIRNFGTFSTHTTKARKGVNPKTLDSIMIPAKRKPKLKFSKSFVEKFN